MTHLTERQKRVLELPYVTKYKRGGNRLCIGWTASHKGPCKNPAKWHFEAMKSSWAKTGAYCWSHLINRGIFGDMEEEARAYRAWRKAGALCSSFYLESDDDYGVWKRYCVRSAHDDPYHHGDIYHRVGSDDEYTPLRCDRTWVRDVV